MARNRNRSRGKERKPQAPSAPPSVLRFAPGLPARLGAVALAAALGAAGCGEPAESSDAAELSGSREAAPPAVRVLRLEPRAVTATVELPADIRPRRRAVLAAEVAGVVESLRVRAGERVRAGQLLMEVETRSLAGQLAEAEAVSRQRLAQFGRAEALLERRSITQAQFLDALTARDVAQARLRSARLQLEKATLKAPWSGSVTATYREVGDFAAVGQRALELVDVSKVEVTASAPASEVPVLEVGARARVTVDIYPDRVFEGPVVRLGAELDPATRTLEVVVRLDNAERLLRPGLSARVRLAGLELESALLVPLSSVLQMEQAQAVYVTLPDGRVSRREVTLGAVLGDDAVVLSGLEAGDSVVIEGQRRVSPGQEVEILTSRVEEGDASAGAARGS